MSQVPKKLAPKINHPRAKFITGQYNTYHFAVITNKYNEKKLEITMSPLSLLTRVKPQLSLFKNLVDLRLKLALRGGRIDQKFIRRLVVSVKQLERLELTNAENRSAF